jgi:polysaccharide deacetylase family protein (PEP-CTERM system associated)
MKASILSIDLEDWHQALRIRHAAGSPEVSEYLVGQIEVLLELLDDAGVKATFFCLGMTARQRPKIIRNISERDHEIQSHGYGHARVYDLDPLRFEEDIRRGKAAIEDITGTEVTGYRAPEFSITPPAVWALETLAENGFEFDSSVFPFSGRRYGWPGFSREPVRITFAGGASLVEFPICTSVVGRRVAPLGGGGYFRLLPFAAISMMRRWSGLRTETFYFHPYEFSKRFLSPRDAVPTLGWYRTLRIGLMQNLNRRSVRGKVRRMLAKGRFLTFGEFLNRGQDLGEIAFSGLR